MDRYASMFTRLGNEKAGAFVPFVMLGDPDLQASKAVIASLVRGGADALELGLPFSDPIADGPVVQAAAVRALNAAASTVACLGLLEELRRLYPEIPIGLLAYANQVNVLGNEKFFCRLASIGIDSILIADLPVEEAVHYRRMADAAGIHLVLIAAHNTASERLNEIARLSSGFVYVVTRGGVTSAESPAEFGENTRRVIDQLQSDSAIPVLIGFGISSPEQVRAALQAGAQGAISGSATIAVLQRHLDRLDSACVALEEFVADMKSATRGNL